MRWSITVVLIISHLIVFSLPSRSLCQQNEMKILKINGPKFAANMGSLQGVSNGSIYIILRNNSLIARAKVVAVRDNICALQLINNTSNKSPLVGDKLILDTSSENDIDLLLNGTNEHTFSPDKLTGSQSYYFSGEQKASAEYSGGGAIVGGLVAGTLLGLIGWALGYAILSSSDINVPAYHLTNLDSQQQFEFISGYKTKAKSKRNGNYHAGAAMGTLIAVIIIFNASD